MSGKRIPGMNDPHSWYPFSAFKFFLIIFRIHFTKELSAIIMIKNELGGRPVRLKVNWCQKSAKALCRKHYGVHLFCQRDTRRRGRHIVRGDFLLKSPLSHFVAAPFQIATQRSGCGGRSSQSLDDFFGTHFKIGKYSILNVPCGTLWD